MKLEDLLAKLRAPDAKHLRISVVNPGRLARTRRKTSTSPGGVCIATFRDKDILISKVLAEEAIAKGASWQ
jgi:hypothetical protein